MLTESQFRELCLEGSSPATGSRMPQATFVPLTEDEAPAPGMLLGLDAEFVALSQPDRRLIGCVAASCYLLSAQSSGVLSDLSSGNPSC